jgi:hypothetical protein
MLPGNTYRLNANTIAQGVDRTIVEVPRGSTVTVKETPSCDRWFVNVDWDASNLMMLRVDLLERASLLI